MGRGFVRSALYDEPMRRTVPLRGDKLENKQGGSVRNTIAIICLLGAFWLMLSGHYTVLLLGMGALSVSLVGWIVHRMDLVDQETIPLHLLHRIPRFYAWLVWQICLSNLDLVRRIWRRQVDVEPVVLRVPMPQRSDVCRVIYANSINLTPGTLTIAMGDGSLLVHTLSQDGAQGLVAGEMSRRISELEN